jgi:hypothetical protein
VTKWPSDEWPSDQLYPVVIVMKFCIVVVCTLKKVYQQVTSDQVTKWPSDQWSSDQWSSDQWKRWWTISSKLQIPMIPTDMSFEFKCLQYPVRLAFAMTINIVIIVWTKFGKSMLLTWTTVCSLLTRWKTFRFIRVHTRKKNKKYCIFKSSSMNTIKTKNEFHLNLTGGVARRAGYS